MPKFTAEIDTETKECYLYRDGNRIPTNEFSISVYEPYCPGEGNPRLHKYLSFTLDGGPDTKVTTSISFKDDDANTYSEVKSNINVSKEVAKIHSRIFAAHNLAKSFNK